ncbi:MAG: glycosyltransferase family 39 protein, partial [Bacteroidota bacterium]
MDHFTTRQKGWGFSIQLLWIAGALAVIGLFLFAGVQPLFLEEPRRSIVAMELLRNANWWVPTQLGQLYYKKPPFFNWLLILSAKLFGDFYPFAMRVPTILSTIGIGVLTVFMGKKYVNTRFGWEAALLTVTSGGIFFYFSTLAEIDLFYSFITLSLFYSIYHFDQINKKYLLFLVVYLLTTIGFLTKGMPSLVFTALSLLTYFIMNKRFKELFFLPHILGILLFFSLSGGYYWIYSQYADPIPYLSMLLGESSDRTLANTS